MSYIAGTGRRRQQSKMAAGQRSTSEASKTVSGEHDVQRRRSFGSCKLEKICEKRFFGFTKRSNSFLIQLTIGTYSLGGLLLFYIAYTARRTKIWTNI